MLLRAAARFGNLFLLAMSILAGVGLAQVRRRYSRSKAIAAVAVATVALANAEALRAQRALLAEKARRTEAMLKAIDAALAREEGATMSDEEKREMFGDLFDGFDPAEYEDEVKERWGETDAYKQSMERTKRYTKADWEQIKAEGEENTNAFIALMEAGVPADSPEAVALAEEHRQHLSKWFYDLPVEFYANMASIWVNDPRFTKNIDKPKQGLAAYKYAAVVALVEAAKAE